jgi:hypothetical protein
MSHSKAKISVMIRLKITIQQKGVFSNERIFGSYSFLVIWKNPPGGGAGRHDLRTGR